MNVAICGPSEDIDEEYVYSILRFMTVVLGFDTEDLHKDRFMELGEGNATADYAVKWSKNAGYEFLTFRADVARYGASAHKRRNERLFQIGVDCVIWIMTPHNEEAANVVHEALIRDIPINEFNGTNLVYENLKK